MPILEPATIERELPFSPEAFGGVTSSEQWKTMLEDFADEESDRIWEWLDRDGVETAFEKTEIEETLDGTGRDELPLPKRPVREVSRVTVYKDGHEHDLEVGTDVVTEPTHLVLIDRDAPIQQFPDRRRAVEVEWTYGYDGVPGDVKDSLVRLVRSRFERIKSDGLESESLPSGQSASYRPPEEIIAAARRSVIKHRPPQYGSGATVI